MSDETALPAPAPDQPQITLSDDERRLVQLAVILHGALTPPPPPAPPAAPAPPAPPEPKAPVWKELLGSTVVATFITVVIGGIAGNYLVDQYQQRAKEQERALEDHKQTLKRQEDIATAAFQLLGEAHSATTGIIALTSPPLQRQNVAKGDVKAIDEKRAALAKRIQDFLDRWEKEKFTTGMLLTYYNADHANQRWSVASQWATSRQATEAMLNAAQKGYEAYQGNTKAPVTISIGEQERAFTRAVDGLAAALEESRSHVLAPPR